MTLTKEQIGIIILIVIAVMVLGGLGYHFYSTGKLTAQGATFQTGLGVGGPSIYNPGNPHSSPAVGSSFPTQLMATAYASPGSTCNCGHKSASCRGVATGGMCNCAECSQDY